LPAGIRWRLVDTSGTTVFEQSLKDDHDLVTATATGTYYLVIDGDPADTAGSRSYSFVVENLGAEPSATALTLGTPVSSSIGVAGERPIHVHADAAAWR
jgi:hypothetical protein